MAYRTRPVYPDAPHNWYEDDAQPFDWYDWNPRYTRPETQYTRTRSEEPAFIEHDAHHTFRGHSSTRPDAEFARTRSADPFLDDRNGHYEYCRHAHGKKNREPSPKKYWARPADGKRRGTLGRLLDVLTGEGPDVFIVLTKSRGTLQEDLPRRAQWSRWEALSYDDDHHGRCRGEERGYARSEPSQFERSGAKQRGKYNFQTRKYEEDAHIARNRMHDGCWTDTRWPDGARRGDMNPQSFRDGRGQWWTEASRDASRF